MQIRSLVRRAVVIALAASGAWLLVRGWHGWHVETEVRRVAVGFVECVAAGDVPGVRARLTPEARAGFDARRAATADATSWADSGEVRLTPLKTGVEGAAAWSDVRLDRAGARLQLRVELLRVDEERWLVDRVSVRGGDLSPGELRALSRRTPDEQLADELAERLGER